MMFSGFSNPPFFPLAVAGPSPVETEQELLRPGELLVRLKKLLHIESSITLASGGSPLS